ncbi:MAG TPA: hypothetical protein VGM82_05180 [Gemmatimonadaceae bacterium]|jgi:Tfp pilus assembly protein PilV
MLADRRRGTALIEALIALVLLGIAGTSVIMVVGQTHNTLRDALNTEQVIDSASAELDEMVLLTRSDLVRRIGWTVRDGFATHIEQITPSLYDVDVARAPGRLPFLRTTLYRSDTSDAR